MREMKKQFLEAHGFAQDGWTVGLDGVLECPHGYRVEDDGECPKGCKSPMRQMGII